MSDKKREQQLKLAQQCRDESYALYAASERLAKDASALWKKGDSMQREAKTGDHRT